MRKKYKHPHKVLSYLALCLRITHYDYDVTISDDVMVMGSSVIGLGRYRYACQNQNTQVATGILDLGDIITYYNISLYKYKNMKPSQFYVLRFTKKIDGNVRSKLRKKVYHFSFSRRGVLVTS
jgi:hypothetical protein